MEFPRAASRGAVAAAEAALIAAQILKNKERRQPGRELVSARIKAARLAARRLWRGSAARQRRFERSNTALERLVLLARDARHILDRLEFVALDQIEVAQPPLRLGAEQRLELAPHTLRNTCRVIH